MCSTADKISISIVSSKKKQTLRMKFDPNMHTLFDVKKAYCDELAKSKVPSKVDFWEMGESLAPDTDKLIEFGFDKAASDQGIEFTMFYRCKGGAQAANVLSRQRNRSLLSSLPRTSDPCCINLDRVGDRTRMKCGHAFTAQSMFDTMKAVLTADSVSYEIRCPICKVKFPFRVCSRVANLDREERAFFVAEITQRAKPEVKACPHCSTECVRPEGLAMYRVNCGSCGGGDWCFMCSGKWVNGGFTVCGSSSCPSANINRTLQRCKEKDGYGVKFPAVRACPRCTTFIAHDVACKHMTCHECAYEFCFVCLKTKVNGSWPCGSYSAQCSPAPRQRF